MSTKLIEADEKEVNLSNNLQALIKNKNVSLNQVAAALGLPVMTIRRLLSGETADPRISTLKLIANYFNISVDTLINPNHSDIIIQTTKSQPIFVPILSWDDAEIMNNISKLDFKNWTQWHPLSLAEQTTISKSSFALESKPSMQPRFPQETLFIFDPEVTPSDSDIVLIKIKDGNELTLRELVIDPPEWQLLPITPGSKAMVLSKNDHIIIAVNILTILYNKKMSG